MELLLLCALAFVSGEQRAHTSLGISSAERAMRKERMRHEKAVQKIAKKHGESAATASRETDRSVDVTTGPIEITLPAAFRDGYHGHTPVARVATPLGRRTGVLAAQGLSWARDTGKGALREFRKRRKAKGHPDPAPVLIPPPPAHPPTVGTEDTGTGGRDAVTPAVTEPGTAEPEPVTETSTADTTPGTGTESPSREEDSPDTGESTTPAAADDTSPAGTEESTEGAASPARKEGVGRMAAEVTYESVMEESDELSLMCDDDAQVHDRIRQRCEREVSKGDEMIAAMRSVGFGENLISKVAHCAEQYQAIHGHTDALQHNTSVQGESVIKAKGRLEAGQGVYAEIAQDMQSVADREVYISDAVDSEDTSAHTETYETRGAA